MDLARAPAASPLPDQAPLIRGQPTYGEVTDQIASVPSTRPTLGWLGLLGLCFAIVLLMSVSITWLLMWGVGVWGVNIPVAWGFAIINFVWWIGIGHAGTLISAILLLLRQGYRTSINRFAEAMTLFAVANAGLFPLLHLGRVWKFYYLFPYPSTLNLWPQWRSALVWDVFAVLTYFTVSLIFWYVGLIPDLATMRDSARTRTGRVLYGIFALGWRGDARHWQNHQMAYLLLAGLATPLVVSVHSIVSLDFSISLLPGWHSTIFPPYFVAGAIFSGFAMVLTIAIPLRAYYKFHNIITERHFDAMSKVMLVSGLIVAYGYVMEYFIAWYSHDLFERAMAHNRAFGDYSPAFWTMIFCNVIVLQALWFRRVRIRPILLFITSLLINVGMWLERFVIIVTSLQRDFMPSAWGNYVPTVWDVTLFVGTLGFFGFLFLLFIRALPSISISEVRELLWERDRAHGHKDEDEDEIPPNDPPPHQPDTPVRSQENEGLLGLMAEFDQPEPLMHAVKQLRANGYRELHAYTPFPVARLPRALGLSRSRVPLLTLVGGIIGASSIFGLMYFSAVIDYPLNIGGRPLNSWQSFIPITFEIGVLCASLCAFLGMLALNGLPAPYHPVFNVPGFFRASRDRFYLFVKSQDRNFDRVRTADMLRSLGSLSVHEMPHGRPELTHQ